MAISPELEAFIREQIENAKKQIAEARALIELAREAGEDVSKQIENLRQAELRLAKWESALRRRGMSAI